jgi:hypothetical protein
MCSMYFKKYIFVTLCDSLCNSFFFYIIFTLYIEKKELYHVLGNLITHKRKERSYAYKESITYTINLLETINLVNFLYIILTLYIEKEDKEETLFLYTK